MSEQHHEEAHTGPIKKPKQLLLAVFFSFVVPIFVIIGLVKFVTSSDTTGAGTANAEMAKAMLGQNRQVLTFQPFTRKQHAIGVAKKLLLAVHHRPTTGLARIQPGRLPAATHAGLRATDGSTMPSARTLSAARSSTLGWVSGRNTAPPSR